VDSFSSEQMGQVEAGVAGECFTDALVEAVARGSVLVAAVDEAGAGDGFGVVLLVPIVSVSLAVESSLMSISGSCNLLLFGSTCLLSASNAGFFGTLWSFCLFLTCIADVTSSISSSLSVEASSGID